MQQFQFENQEELESDHMTQTEAAEVIRLWAQKQRDAATRSSSPTIHDVAEGLEIPADEARGLLLQVRDQSSTAILQGRPAERDNGPLLAATASFAAATILLSALIGTPSWFALLASGILLALLVKMRRYSFAALALFLLLALYVGVSRVQTAAEPPAAIKMEAPPSIPPPPPPPAAPMPSPR